MYRCLLITAPMLSMLFGVWLAAGFPSHVEAAEPADAAALRAIERLGGWAREIAADSDDWEVGFFGNQQPTDEALPHVTGLKKNVVTLNLKGSKITNAGLVHLRGLTKLRQLHLEKTAVGDEGIAHLKGLAELEYLNLYATKVTDKSLEHLRGLKKLRRLYLWQTDVTDKGVARLEKALPELKIVRGADISKLALINPIGKAGPLKWIAATGKKAPKSNTGSIITVLFENKSKRRVKLYWVGYNGRLKLYGQIDPGATRNQNTYSEATWLVTDEKDKPLGHFITAFEDARAVIPGKK
ncbi:MAG: hypothetical protein IIA67_05390 [Planctomycetes bacterium]|nr:hypothetical protein [Planctomycetota bacterium]